MRRTIDAAFVSILYRILHVHCSENPSSEALRSLRGKVKYSLPNTYMYDSRYQVFLTLLFALESV